MSQIADRIVRFSPFILVAALIWLPQAIAENPTSRPAASRAAATSGATTSQPVYGEIELHEGRRMIEETAAVYKNCKSYQDEGTTVRGDDLNHDGKLRIQAISFKTAFVRPGRCRFEYRDSHNREASHIFFANDKDVRTWWRNPPHEEKVDNVPQGFAGIWYMSGGDPYVIPALLMPDKLGEFSLTTLKNIRFAGNEKSNGATFYMVDADDGPLVNYRIWINADTKLICKIFKTGKFPAWPTERTTHYTPKINVDIPAADLEFNPPNK